MAYGLNLNWQPSWTNARSFSNLAAGGISWRTLDSGWPVFDPQRVDRDGTVLSLKPNEHAIITLSTPQGAFDADTRVRCTWDGKGEVHIHEGKDEVSHRNSLDFVWPRQFKQFIAFELAATDPKDPVRHVDCREPDADRNARFDPRFLRMLKPYALVRFQGWQRVNDHDTTGRWDERTLPSHPIASQANGVSVEDMVALCNQAGVDPWFTMPWQADATYQANFARYVHDHLDPKRTVYVEIGNEVWNWGFANAHWALEEGQTEGLDKDGNLARMRRYAEHATEGFRIWQAAFGADRGRIVRVLAGQAVWPDLLKLALDWKDTARQVDAIAMAPYFGYDFFDRPRDTADMDALFRDLGGKVDEAVATMAKDKALADAYGLRLVTYEAGQHLRYDGPDKTVIGRLARDPRMEALYRRYIDGWKAQAGDLITFFTDVEPITDKTDWGMVEWPGQPPAETPKVRALLAAQAAEK